MKKIEQRKCGKDIQKTFFGEAIGGWSPKGRQPGQAGEPGWEGAILLPRPD